MDRNKHHGPNITALPTSSVSSVDSLHPACGTADHAQRDAEASDAPADGTASARLTVKTVAAPQSCQHGRERQLISSDVCRGFQEPEYVTDGL